MKDLHYIIRRPIVTEKSTDLKEKYNQVLVEVAADANKIEIKQAVEKIFKVHVADVRTMKVAGKSRRIGRKVVKKKGEWKKAIVTLKEGETIEFFEGA